MNTRPYGIPPGTANLTLGRMEGGSRPKPSPFAPVWGLLRCDTHDASGAVVNTDHMGHLKFRRDAPLMSPACRFLTHHRTSNTLPPAYLAYSSFVTDRFIVAMTALSRVISTRYERRSRYRMDGVSSEDVFFAPCMSFAQLPSIGSERATASSAVEIVCKLTTDFAVAAYVCGGTIRPTTVSIVSDPITNTLYLAATAVMENAGCPPIHEHFLPTNEEWYHGLSLLVMQAVYTTTCREGIWDDLKEGDDRVAYLAFLRAGEARGVDVSSEKLRLSRTAYPYPPCAPSDYRSVLVEWYKVRRSLFPAEYAFGLVPDEEVYRLDATMVAETLKATRKRKRAAPGLGLEDEELDLTDDGARVMRVPPVHMGEERAPDVPLTMADITPEAASTYRADLYRLEAFRREKARADRLQVEAALKSLSEPMVMNTAPRCTPGLGAEETSDEDMEQDVAFW